MNSNRVAYFSMEIAFDDNIPSYSGGLGVLAGDFLATAHDLGIPMVGVTILPRKGYFKQVIENGVQREETVDWRIEDSLEEVAQRVVVQIEGRDVTVRAWKYIILETGNVPVPIYMLDTDLPENSEYDRSLSYYLYGGDCKYRLCQEVILGIGGIRLLNAIGISIQRYHLNEGHVSLLALELLSETAKKYGRDVPDNSDINEVRSMCVFTTHTPVPAGHDQFPYEMAMDVIRRPILETQKNIFCVDDKLNMTYVALNLCYYVNGVAQKHQEVTKTMFSSYGIDAITNGVRAKTWTSPYFHTLFDRYIPGWSLDNFSLRYARSIPHEEIWNAHIKAKENLFAQINAGFDVNVFTLGFARRMTGYKRATLIFDDIERLKKLGPLQIVFAGKAHPQDHGGKELINRIYQYQKELEGIIKIVYLPNYDRRLAKILIPGVDVWLNNPQRPLEASGTSGMKAALNGVPSLSVLDGWWIEGHTEGVTGWAIGGKGDNAENDSKDLLDKLGNVVMPLYYHNREEFINVMAQSIAFNGSFFNTQRMLVEYSLKAYGNVSCSLI